MKGTVTMKTNFSVLSQNGGLYRNTAEKDCDLTCGLEERLEAGKQQTTKNILPFQGLKDKYIFVHLITHAH